jgi:cobalt ECF transporter T component CbiQ
MEHFAIDMLAYTSKYRKLPPLGKLLLALALILPALLAPSPFLPLLVLVIATILLYSSTRFYFTRFLVLVYLDTILIISVGSLIIAFITPGSPIWTASWGPISISLSSNGINLAILVFTRALATFTTLLFFATSTPIPHLFAALRQVRISQSISELAILIYRYSFLFIEQIGQMNMAAQCRVGFRDWRTSIKTISTIAACVFGRSMDFAERAQFALYCRNFQGTFYSFKPPNPLTMIWIVVPFATFVTLFLIGYFTSGWLVV